MNNPKRPKKRPGILVRFHTEDLRAINAHCANTCTPRENWVRRVALAALPTPKASAQRRPAKTPTPKKGSTTL